MDINIDSRVDPVCRHVSRQGALQSGRFGGTHHKVERRGNLKIGNLENGPRKKQLILSVDVREGTLCVGTFRSHSSQPCFHSLISLLKMALQQSDPTGTNQGPLCTSRGPWSLCGILGWREQDRVTMGSGAEAPVAPGLGQPFILYVL